MVIENDLRCIECGYNLRGLGERSRCPECGASVQGTFERRHGRLWLRVWPFLPLSLVAAHILALVYLVIVLHAVTGTVDIQSIVYLSANGIMIVVEGIIVGLLAWPLMCLAFPRKESWLCALFVVGVLCVCAIVYWRVALPHRNFAFVPEYLGVLWPLAFLMSLALCAFWRRWR